MRISFYVLGLEILTVTNELPGQDPDGVDGVTVTRHEGAFGFAKDDGAPSRSRWQPRDVEP